MPEGHHCTHTGHPLSAKDYSARRENPAALVAVLPDINVLQLLAEIKQRFHDLPVMMVTAYGAAEFITKPVDFDFLKEQLRQLSTAVD
jgi:DNA-binding NtrC family response regulator